jgi:signal recognition particle GTPase
MARMMKKMGKMGGLGGLKNMMSSLGGGTQNSGEAQNPTLDPNKMAELQKMMGGNMPNLGNMANRFGGMGLPGLGGKPSKKRR